MDVEQARVLMMPFQKVFVFPLPFQIDMCRSDSLKHLRKFTIQTREDGPKIVPVVGFGFTRLPEDVLLWIKPKIVKITLARELKKIPKETDDNWSRSPEFCIKLSKVMIPVKKIPPETIKQLFPNKINP